MMRQLCSIVAIWLAAPLAADPGLPPPEAAVRAIDEHPSVTAARARLDAARARADGLRRGPYEFTVQTSRSVRSVQGGNDFDEYDAQLSRTIRLPGKARRDREIGEYGITAADNIAEDARHEAALLLASHWYDWLAAAAQAEADRGAVGNYTAALAALERRRDLRDASQLDVDRANAALADARRMLEQSQGMAALARSRLEAQFPGLALPVDAPPIAVPQVDEADLAAWAGDVIANSHLIAARSAETAREAAVADRASADRLPDPTIGIRAYSEFGGIERGAGVTLSLPIGGGQRRALASEAAANAAAAEAEERLARMEVAQTARADVAEVRLRLATWQRAREAVEAQMAALDRLRRGQQLGEIDLADRLLGERMVHEAFRIESDARAQAMRAITKLRIDAHDLWLAD